MSSEAPVKDFVLLHGKQLRHLNIPSCLYGPLASQLNRTFAAPDGNGSSTTDLETVLRVSRHNFNTLHEQQNEFGSLVVIPHLCSWDMATEPSQGMWKSLEELPVPVLKKVLAAMDDLFGEDSLYLQDDLGGNRTLLNKLCVPRTWSRVILYRQEGTNRVRAALPVPPYLPQVELENETDPTESDLTGPFQFRYHLGGDQVIDCSLGYLSPGFDLRKDQLPTLDVCPSYGSPNALTRSVRYAALLEDRAPQYCLQQVKGIHAGFVQRMHLIRQQKLKRLEDNVAEIEESQDETVTTESSIKVWKVYTDMDDPMQLSHPDSGLTSPDFALTSSIEDADIVYSYRSLFAPGDLRKVLDDQPHILINQFPYEGAFVQKDHLGREILRQHGLPRPTWALETYDLDVQLAEFVGAALLESERDGKENPLWIVKPARGTQSKGHVVTRSLAHILRLVDCGGESRVAQRYIENPICYEGRKVDCRCIVMMTSAGCPGRPTLFMHNRVYFRIASEKHSVSLPSDLIDKAKVLTAMHLVNEAPSKELTSNEITGKLPVDNKTIAHLEKAYTGFDWEGEILPKIHTMIKELFNGMTEAYSDMAKASNSRALYGVDVMFDIDTDGVVEPKLTEVTFCPANNAICDAYERDDLLYHQYNNDVFSCLFLGRVNDTITRLQ